MSVRDDNIHNMRIAVPMKFGPQGGTRTPVAFEVIHYPKGTVKSPGEYWIVGKIGLAGNSVEENVRCNTKEALGRVVAQIVDMPALPVLEFDVNVLPKLDVSDTPGPGTIVPYKWHKSGAIVKYPKVGEMPLGSVFQDAKQQLFKVLSNSSVVAIVADADGKTYQVDSSLRGKAA